ncbi:uncharacterized protein LOC141720094 [Apium graveolens]|uniref:uncharacterized protein LOC141720094 n=1 Tax=Apium graveolens TaxID=4045 RepID=UPI003D7A7C23
MATTSNLELTVSSSSFSSPSSWDVFLSFYGKDTRRNFISHLYSALDQADIRTFMDDPQLEKGREISSGLLEAIQRSKMFVVVISENYARSSWCLNELVEILKCMGQQNHVVPVFYYVDPLELRHQKGSFGEAFQVHKTRYYDDNDMIDKWKSALAQIAEISGYHLKKHANENEAETIKKIVENVAQRVSTRVLHLEENLFGIDYAVEEIYQKLRIESNDVRAIGICGMGGIGKTTTAKTFYNKYYNIFDISCFVENVKQHSLGSSPLIPLLNQVLNGFLRNKDYKVIDAESGFKKLKRILSTKKALIVLDDLDQPSYSEFLLRLCSFFSAGSRIIITTRDLNMLNQLKMDISEVDMYMVKKLGLVDSLELFSNHAFRKSTPPPSLRELSVNFVTYAGGIPLALKVLGSSLCGRTQDESFWKAKLEKVRRIPENEILEILQLSYNELGDETMKSIFLDIAFFFVGKHKRDAVEIFRSCDFHPEVGIQILLERCLLTIDDSSKFQMHDLLQEMGRKLAKSKHLFLRENAWEELQNQEKSDEIEGLVIDLTQSTEKNINSQIFENFPKLRLLEIFGAPGINIKGRFKNSFQELRCIYWNHCTWTQLPSSFRPPNLVCLQMQFSGFNLLWNDRKSFKRLKVIDVSYSVNLKETPNFENSKFVEELYFNGCGNLLKVHPSIRKLSGLYVLNLEDCFQLKELPESVEQITILDHLYSFVKRSPQPTIQWDHMGYLWLGLCSNLRRLPKQLGDMKRLKLLEAGFTAIEELPDSVTQLKELIDLKLECCKKLRKLPEQIGNMEGLRTIHVSGSAIEELPDSFVHLINLEILDLSCCINLRNLPSSLWKLQMLQVLNLQDCLKLERLPEELGKMQCLEELDASRSAIEEVPSSVGLLSRLRVLGLGFCRNLKYVPDSVWNLASLTHLYIAQADNCMICLPNTVKNMKLVGLTLSCDIRLWLPTILSFPCLEQLLLRDEGGSISSTKPFSLSKLDKLQSLELYYCPSFGSSFPELPLNLTQLCLWHHATLVHLPDLSCLRQLKSLVILDFVSLESLPLLPPHLQSLTVNDCRRLQELPDMSMLKELVGLSFGRSCQLDGLEQFFVQVKRQFFSLFKDRLTNFERPEWFSYQSGARTLSFDIPPLLGDSFLGLAIWVLFKSKNYNRFNIKAVVTNKTSGLTKYYWIPVFCIGWEEVFCLVKCISIDKFSITSGDRIEVSFSRKLYGFSGEKELPFEEVMVEMCAANVIQKTTITPDFPSVLKSLIDRDTRENFTARLYSDLVQAEVITFMDDPELEKGEEISKGLLKAIHDSKMFLVVLSKNYAYSSWCLNELLAILNSKRTENQIVPVFYYVDPSSVRYQKGSFGEALERHKKYYSVDMIEKWKSALAKIAELSGYHLKENANENESDTIQKIVENVARQACKKVLYLEEYLFGIDSAVEDIYQKLSLQSDDVRALGICGIGGIGKTTVAKAFYNKYSNMFDVSCFLENLKQFSNGDRPPSALPLLKQLLTVLLRKKEYKVYDVATGITKLTQVLSSKKALIVLDDLDQSSSSIFLAKLCSLLSAGSRIMITTRDANLPIKRKIDLSHVDIYMVKKLGSIDSLQLFCYHAFGRSTPPEFYRELSVSFVTYAGGLPLALKVLGSSLRGRTQVSFWKEKLEKVRIIPEKEILKILQLSYDELDEIEKAIFLDIVFFFIGKDKDEAVHIFKSCNFFPDVGIPILLERCLLTVDDNNKFQMHNLIQDVGKKVMREESKHLYLCPANASDLLQNRKGIEEIEGLVIDLTMSVKKQMTANFFDRLPNLRLLEIIDASDIKGDLKNSFRELRCIRWSYCSWTHLPSSFCPQKLISLNMPCSGFKTLWKDAMPLKSLKIINVNYSKNLKSTPDFRDLKLIEKLNFRGCRSLQKVHPSIVHLTNLSHLDLSECSQLTELPHPIGQLFKLSHLDLRDCHSLARLPEPIKQLKNLGCLDLGNCRNLNQLPDQLGDMKGLKMLNASHTAIEQLPDSIVYLTKLAELKLVSCKKLRKLPEQLGNMECLRAFDASCTAIQELPDSIGCLSKLVELDLFNCKYLISLPNSMQNLKLLKKLNLYCCSKLEQLPEEMGKMQSLEVLSAYGTAIEELPDSIGQLSRLQVLDLSLCRKLKNLPNSIGNLTSVAMLSLDEVSMIRTDLPDMVKNLNPEELSLKCNLRLCETVISNLSSLVRLHLTDDGEAFSSTNPLSLSKLINLQDLTLNDCTSLGLSFPELPRNLKELKVFKHASLKQLPDLSSVKQLKSLCLERCISLQSLTFLPPHLEKLDVFGCTSLQNLPDLSILKDLKHLDIIGCSSNLKVSMIDSLLQVGLNYFSSFKAHLSNQEIAEWFSYKSSGGTLSFDIPPMSEDDFLGIAIWIVYTCKKTESHSHIRAVFTNKTEGTRKNYDIYEPYHVVGEVQSKIECIRGDKISVKSGDRVKVSIQSLLYCYSSEGLKVPCGEVKVKMCGAHVIQRMPSV